MFSLKNFWGHLELIRTADDWDLSAKSGREGFHSSAVLQTIETCLPKVNGKDERI